MGLRTGTDLTGLVAFALQMLVTIFLGPRAQDPALKHILIVRILSMMARIVQETGIAVEKGTTGDLCQTGPRPLQS